MTDESQQAEGGQKRVYYEFVSEGVTRSFTHTSPPAKKTCYGVSEIAPPESALSGNAEMSFEDYFALMKDLDLKSILEPSQDTSTHHPAGSTGQSATETAVPGNDEKSSDDPLGLLGTTQETGAHPPAELTGQSATDTAVPGNDEMSSDDPLGLLGTTQETGAHPTAELTRQLENFEIPAIQTALPGHELSFDEYFALLDRFDAEAVLETNQDTSTDPVARSVGQSENDRSLHTSVVETGKFDHSKVKEEQLDLQKPRGTLLTGFLDRKTPPLASNSHGEGFFGTGVLIPSAGDMPEFDHDVEEAVDPYRLPDLAGSPLSDYDPTFLAIPSTSAEQPARVVGPQTEKKRGRVKGTMQQIPGFPNTVEALPPNLSLEEVASSWPNHLAYEHLEPFVEAGWNAKKIWGFMPDAAKQLIPKPQLLNRLNKRLLQTRRQMELQGVGSVGAGLTAESMWNNLMDIKIEAPTQDSSAFGASRIETRSTSSSATVSALPDSGNMMQYSPSAESGPSMTTTKRDQSAAKGAIEVLKQAFQVQLDEQATIIGHILSYRDKDWILICHLEATCRVNEFWMENARQHEDHFLRETCIDAADIPFGKTDQTAMLRRLGELLCRAIIASEPSRLATNAEEEEVILEERLLKVLQHELCILEGWTNSWKEQLDQIDAAFVWDAISEIAPSENKHKVQDGHDSERMLAQTPMSPGSERCVLRIEDKCSTNKTALADSDSQTSSCSTSSTKQRHYGGIQNQMFPAAPSKYVDLNNHDLADKDSILRRFPEHLGLNHVMERFLAPIGSRRGSYPSKLMVDKLWHHHNGKHGSDLNHPDRFKGLYDWVMSKKDGARRARRTRLGLQNETKNSIESDVCSDEEISDDGLKCEEEDSASTAPAEDRELV
jgi:hypothetical protein